MMEFKDIPFLILSQQFFLIVVNLYIKMWIKQKCNEHATGFLIIAHIFGAKWPKMKYHETSLA